MYLRYQQPDHQPQDLKPRWNVTWRKLQRDFRHGLTLWQLAGARTVMLSYLSLVSSWFASLCRKSFFSLSL